MGSKLQVLIDVSVISYPHWLKITKQTKKGLFSYLKVAKKGEKSRQTEEEVGRQHQGMDRCGVRPVPEGSGEQGKLEKTGCKIICGAPRTPAVKGLMMMMMMMKKSWFSYCSSSAKFCSSSMTFKVLRAWRMGVTHNRAAQVPPPPTPPKGR